jgi:ATP synthase protein I
MITVHEYPVKRACEFDRRKVDSVGFPEACRISGRARRCERVQLSARNVSLFLMSDEQRDDKAQSGVVLWARYSNLAFIIPAAVVVGLLVGKLFDYWFHTHWLFIAGVILGAVAGFIDLIRTVMRDKDLSGK